MILAPDYLQPRDPAPHILVITAVPESDPGEHQVNIGCPGVTDTCRMWQGCRSCYAADDRVARYNQCADDGEYDGAGECAGTEHRIINGDLMTPTERCFVQANDHLLDAVQELAPAGQPMPAPGWYPIGHKFDEEDVELWYVDPQATW